MEPKELTIWEVYRYLRDDWENSVKETTTIFSHDVITLDYPSLVKEPSVNELDVWVPSRTLSSHYAEKMLVNRYSITKQVIPQTININDVND